MHVLPILSTLGRHRTAATLIVLEIALTCAIVCNAVFVIDERLTRMDRPSGVVENEFVRVLVTGIGIESDADATTAQDLVALRAIPGVTSVAVANMVPFGKSSWNSSIRVSRDDTGAIHAATYAGSVDLLETLGVELVAGRDFLPDEYVSQAAVDANEATLSSVIITRGVANRLYPGKNPLGQPLYMGGDPHVIVGVISRLARPNASSVMANADDYAIVIPATMPYTTAGNYVLRVESARRTEVLAAVDAALDKVDPSRIILERQTFDQLRANYFKQDRAMAYLLVGVSIALVIVTALGIIGLASFWVQQRTRQIGIRRALGATRGDIVRYFQVENFILATAGIAVGMGLAYAINLWLMSTYGVERMPASVLPLGAFALWFLGQAAVLAPALRAAAIPPAIATRSV